MGQGEQCILHAWPVMMMTQIRELQPAQSFTGRSKIACSKAAQQQTMYINMMQNEPMCMASRPTQEASHLIVEHIVGLGRTAIAPGQILALVGCTRVLQGR